MRKNKKADTVSKALENLIKSHSLSAGDRLPPYNDLCVELSVSYMSIHRAMKKMESEGKVSVLPGNGVFLRDQKNHSSQIKVTLNHRIGELLTSKDLREIQHCIPNVFLRFAQQDKPDEDCDLAIINNEQLLLFAALGKIQTAENLGASMKTLKNSGIKKEILEQAFFGGALQGVPIGINPVLFGALGKYLPEVENGEKWTLDKFCKYGIKLTENNGKPLEGTFGFCFANRTVHVHSLINSAGAGWKSEKDFFSISNISALEKIWSLIHHIHSCFPEVPSTTQLMPSDRWSMNRIAMMFCTYSGVSELLSDNKNNREVVPWGGESAYYYVLTAKKGFKSSEIYTAVLKKLLEKNIQQKLLRQRKALPVTNDSFVKKRMQHFFGITLTAKLEKICVSAYNPWKLDGCPEAFFKSEYVVKDFLADILPLSNWKKLAPDFGLRPNKVRLIPPRSI